MWLKQSAQTLTSSYCWEINKQQNSPM